MKKVKWNINLSEFPHPFRSKSFDEKKEEQEVIQKCEKCGQKIKKKNTVII